MAPRAARLLGVTLAPRDSTRRCLCSDRPSDAGGGWPPELPRDGGGRSRRTSCHVAVSATLVLSIGAYNTASRDLDPPRSSWRQSAGAAEKSDRPTATQSLVCRRLPGSSSHRLDTVRHRRARVLPLHILSRDVSKRRTGRLRRGFRVNRHTPSPLGNNNGTSVLRYGR